MGVIGAQWGSLGVIGAQWVSVGFRGVHWRLSKAQWGLLGPVGLSGGHWVPVELSGTQCTMYIYPINN